MVETLECGAEIDLDLIEVDGMNFRRPSFQTLGPEQVMDQAGLSGQGDLYNHHHCQYSRCVNRAS